MTEKQKAALASAITVAGVLAATAALASQGPGAGPGPVSAPVQTLMAVLVYGFCGATVLMAAMIDLWK